ncbi:hypothetical protein ABZ353_24100 [Streptomyces niveus]
MTGAQHGRGRTVEILVDRGALTYGAACGELWQYYEFGYGLCSYTFFE